MKINLKFRLIFAGVICIILFAFLIYVKFPIGYSIIILMAIYWFIFYFTNPKVLKEIKESNERRRKEEEKIKREAYLKKFAEEKAIDDYNNSRKRGEVDMGMFEESPLEHFYSFGSAGRKKRKR